MVHKCGATSAGVRSTVNNSYSIPRIAAHLARGGVIAYPTESCYGFGCDPRNRAAVRRVLKLKQRPQRKGLILIASDYRQVARFLKPLASAEQAQLREDGAEAVTYLMPVKPSCPRWLRGAHDTLAVRITAHPAAAALCRALNMALVSTSANVGGDRPARTYADCRRRFGRKALVLPGRVGRRKRPSTIRAWVDGRIVRS
jgi:L-threonylcarbamoyladenylate synthase